MNTIDRSEWIRWALFVILLVLLSVIVFRCVLPADTVLFSTDDNYGHIVLRKSVLPDSMTGFWQPSPLLGGAGTRSINLTNMLMWLFPAETFTDWFHALCLSLASLFLVMFMRLRRCCWSGCIIAALTAFWLGTNLSLSHAGHINKFGVLVFVSIALWSIEKMVLSKRASWAVLSGGAVSVMFLEQQDVALFLGLFIGAYAVFSIVREEGWKYQALLKYLLPMGALILLIAGPSVLQIYTSVKGGEGDASEAQKTPQEQWDFCTQWSVSPDESIDLIAPGYFGWNSSDMTGPYWGRTGQSADWNATKKGFRNFRLEGVYLGAIPVALACLSLLIVIVGRIVRQGRKQGEDSDDETEVLAEHWKKDIVFWSIAALIAILLSFGRYFPLYRIFYQLPGISSIRNPNKFLHIFQVAVGVLAGYGISAVLEEVATGSNKRTVLLVKRVFVGAFVLLGLVLLIKGFLLSLSRSYHEQAIAVSWGNMAPVILGNMIRALIHGGIMLLLCAGAVLGIMTDGLKKASRTILTAGLVVVVIVDLCMFASHYIKPMSLSGMVDENIVVEYLKKNVGDQRVMLVTQSGFYNNWLTFLFPRHGIQAFNITQAPRMPQEYKNFLGIVGRNTLRLWQLSSVGYVLAPVQLYNQMQQDPYLKGTVEAAIDYNVVPLDDGVGVLRGTSVRPGQHVVLRFNKGLPMYSLKTDWDIVPDKNACRSLLLSSFDPTVKVIVSSSTADGLKRSAGYVPGGSVDVYSRDSKKVVLTADVKTSSILLFVQRYMPNWNVTVDGKPGKILKCNYICQGVYLDAGKHQVVFAYSPDMRPLMVQVIGLLVCLVAVVWMMGIRMRRGIAGSKKDARQ